MNGKQIIPSAFCWSKMGVESGESLEEILNRKEIERQANGGAFTWGVGNSLGKSIVELMACESSPEVVFTKMKSKPKSIDIKPDTLVLWLTYLDKNGEERNLPEFSFLTSRGNTEHFFRKKAHYALLCKNETPISICPNLKLNSTKLRNYLTGNQVGHSQVTSVVKQDKSCELNDEKLYTEGFRAYLIDEGQVRLQSGIQVSENELRPVFLAAKDKNLVAWKRELTKLKKVKSDSVKSADFEPQLALCY